MLSAAVTSTPVEAKKEKKRKLKETAVPVTPTVGDSEKKVSQAMVSFVAKR